MKMPVLPRCRSARPSATWPCVLVERDDAHLRDGDVAISADEERKSERMTRFMIVILQRSGEAGGSGESAA